MAYYEPEANSRLVIYANPFGLDAVFEQKQADESRPLTAVERRYSQVEREALAVLWSCQRFHVYLYGTDFTMITDHKPLEKIFSLIHQGLPRIQRWVMSLQPYRFKVIFQPGSLNAADILSRSPTQNDDKSSKLSHWNSTEEYVQFIAGHSVPKTITRSEIEPASADDVILN